MAVVRDNIGSVASAELFCAECGRCAEAEAQGWRAYLVDADDYEGDEVLFFCPMCAAREFGELRRRPYPAGG